MDSTCNDCARENELRYKTALQKVYHRIQEADGISTDELVADVLRIVKKVL